MSSHLFFLLFSFLSVVPGSLSADETCPFEILSPKCRSLCQSKRPPGQIGQFTIVCHKLHTTSPYCGSICSDCPNGCCKNQPDGSQTFECPGISQPSPPPTPPVQPPQESHKDSSDDNKTWIIVLGVLAFFLIVGLIACLAICTGGRSMGIHGGYHRRHGVCPCVADDGYDDTGPLSFGYSVEPEEIAVAPSIFTQPSSQRKQGMIQKGKPDVETQKAVQTVQEAEVNPTTDTTTYSA